MNARELAFWRRLQRRAASLTPDMASALLKSFDDLRADLSEQEFAQVIRSGTLERLFSSEGPLSETALERALRPFRDQLRAAVVTSTRLAGNEIGPGIGFDLLNPKVIDAVRSLETRVMGTLKQNVRDVVRQHVEAGLFAGVPHTTIARQLKSIVSLAPNQVEAVRNFRRLLESGDREALLRELRDKRFDRTLQKALGRNGTGLTAAQVAAMAAAYERGMVAHNAATIARTAVLDAQKLGQRLSWLDAIERRIVDRSRLFRRWAGVLDARERDSHVAMEGAEAQFDMPYSNGQMVPGDDEWGCRCIEIFFVAPA